MRRTSPSMARSSSGREGAVEGEVEAQVVGRDQRARLAGPLPDGVAQGAVEQVRAGVVAHRARTPLGVHDGLDRLADAEAAVQAAAVDDQPAQRAADRLLGVLDLEERRAAARLAQHARGRRPGRHPRRRRASREDDLRGALARSAPRTRGRRAGWPPPSLRPRSSRSRGTRSARCGAGWPRRAAPTRPAATGRPWCPCALRARCSSSAASKPARSTRTPYSAASSTVRSMGKP